MRSFVAARLLLGGLLALTSCATAQMQLSPDQTLKAQRALVGAQRYTRVSLHVTPFFGDATRRFLSPTDPKHVELVLNPDGTPIVPGPISQTVAPGTRAKIVNIEFPSGFAMADRVLVTPRTLIWVTVEFEGQPKNALPLTLVLRPGLRDDTELMAEVDRYLSTNNPGELLAGFTEPVREAVKQKKALVEMPAAALEMAWGYPDRRSMKLEGDAKVETWFWGTGKTNATLKNGVVTALVDP